jgi:toxin FitB
MMIILDTNVISELMRSVPDPQVRDWLNSLGNTPLGTTAVTLSELEFGLGRLPEGQRRKELLARCELLLHALPILPFDELAAHEAARLQVIRASKGLTSHTTDLFIAGIAAAQCCTLATRNTRDFAELPLELINPWDAGTNRADGL